MKKVINILLIVFFAFSNIALGIDDTLRVPVGVDKLRAQETIVPYSIKEIKELLGKVPNKPKEYYGWGNAINPERLALALTDGQLKQEANKILQKLTEFKLKKKIEEVNNALSELKKAKDADQQKQITPPTVAQKPAFKPRHEKLETTPKPVSKESDFGQLKSTELIERCLNVIKGNPAFEVSIYITPADITNRGLNFAVKHPSKEGETLNFSISAKYNENNKVSCIEIVVGGREGLIDSIRLYSENEIKLKDAESSEKSKLEKFLSDLSKRLETKKVIAQPQPQLSKGPWNRVIEGELNKMLGNDMIVHNFTYSPEEMSIIFYNPTDEQEKLRIQINNKGTQDKPYFDIAIYYLNPRALYDRGDIIDTFSATDDLSTVMRNLTRYIISSEILRTWRDEVKKKSETNQKALKPYIDRIMKDFLTPEELEECDDDAKVDWKEDSSIAEVIFTKKHNKDKKLIVVIRFLSSENIEISACVEQGSVRTDKFGHVRYASPLQLSSQHFNEIKSNSSAKVFLQTEMHSFMFTIFDMLMKDPDIVLFEEYNKGYVQGTKTRIIQEKKGDDTAEIDIYHPLTENFKLTLSMQYSPTENVIYMAIYKVEIRSRTPESKSLGRFKIHNINMDDINLQSCIETLKEDTPFKDWLSIVKKEIGDAGDRGITLETRLSGKKPIPTRISSDAGTIKDLFKNSPDINIEETWDDNKNALTLICTANKAVLKFVIENSGILAYEKLDGGEFEEVKGLSLENIAYRFLYVNDIVTKFLTSEQMKNVGVTVEGIKEEERFIRFYNKAISTNNIIFTLKLQSEEWLIYAYVYSQGYRIEGKNNRRKGYDSTWIERWFSEIRDKIQEFMPKLLEGSSTPSLEDPNQTVDHFIQTIADKLKNDPDIQLFIQAKLCDDYNEMIKGGTQTLRNINIKSPKPSGEESIKIEIKASSIDKVNITIQPVGGFYTGPIEPIIVRNIYNFNDSDRILDECINALKSYGDFNIWFRQLKAGSQSQQPAGQEDIVAGIKALFKDAPDSITVQESLNKDQAITGSLKYSLGNNILMFSFHSSKICIYQTLGGGPGTQVLEVDQSAVTEDIKFLAQKFLYINDILTRFVSPAQMKNVGTRIIGFLNDEEIAVEFFNKHSPDNKIKFVLQKMGQLWYLDVLIGVMFEYIKSQNIDKYDKDWLPALLAKITNSNTVIREFMPKLLAEKTEEKTADSELGLSKETVEHTKALVEAYSRLYVLYLAYKWGHLEDGGIFNNSIASDLKMLGDLDDPAVNIFLKEFKDMMAKEKDKLQSFPFRRQIVIDSLYYEIDLTAYYLKGSKHNNHSDELIENLAPIVYTLEILMYEQSKYNEGYAYKLKTEYVEKLDEIQDPAVLPVFRQLLDKFKEMNSLRSYDKEIDVLTKAISHLETIAKKYDMTFADNISRARSSI